MTSKKLAKYKDKRYTEGKGLMFKLELDTIADTEPCQILHTNPFPKKNEKQLRRLGIIKIDFVIDGQSEPSYITHFHNARNITFIAYECDM